VITVSHHGTPTARSLYATNAIFPERKQHQHDDPARTTEHHSSACLDG
jgi:hypothetical protein